MIEQEYEDKTLQNSPYAKIGDQRVSQRIDFSKPQLPYGLLFLHKVSSKDHHPSLSSQKKELCPDKFESCQIRWASIFLVANLR